ncbi:Flavocytochrome c [Mytilinidion resinicola]|uniref:Fumarate reductase n=1 Tax=Mytilinidion resinicola TaxID=574789 RepID=A0A6A6Y146_9PEZI|nr:Flavocytochrome c [Mytilinidion resinicola]KAF2802536.1 Flavocytochrome c [Mytilinidion resinicola]
MSRTRALTLLILSILGIFAAYQYNRSTMATTPKLIPTSAIAKNGAIVVGSGLAGLSAASELIAANIPVRLLERNAKPGGNSIKASSGINGAPTLFQPGPPDTEFYADTIKSAGYAMSTAREHREKLIGTLTNSSASAVTWLNTTHGIDLSKVAQLGGHSRARTHRGAGGTPPGFAIVSTLLKSLKASPLFELKTSCTVNRLLRSGSSVTGVEYTCISPEAESTTSELHGPVIVTTGGFAGDAAGLLATHRPDLANFPSTNDPAPGFTHLLTSVGAQLLDMSSVQVHPTGFVDPANPSSPLKFLAAEVLRGEGGILLHDGERFFNELETREKVTAAILKNPPIEEKPKQWDVLLVLDEGVYEAAKSHIDFYIFKGLIRKTTIGDLGEKALPTIQEYAGAVAGKYEDKFGRTAFANWKLLEPEADSVVYVGRVTPVVHFTMGGVVISEKAEVLDAQGVPVEGVWAAGEVTGGVHGGNRLGGSSLLECVVFGRNAGERVVEYVKKEEK